MAVQPLCGSTTGRHPFLRQQSVFRVTILDSYELSRLSQLVRDRERDLDQKQEEVAKQQDLLEHDRDIRELMGARDLYVAEVHDVSGTGQTNKTYGRVFFTKGFSADLRPAGPPRNIALQC